MEWLKTLLENAKITDGALDIDALMKSINAEFPKHAVPKSTFNDVSKELKTANETIENLKKENGDNVELQKRITEHEQTIETLKQEAENTRKTYALKEQLTGAGVLDPDYIIYKQGGVEKFTFDDSGKPVGIDDILKPMREAENTAHLFRQDVKRDYTPVGGGSPSGKNPFAKDSWNLTEQGKLLKENPQQAKILAAEAGITI